MTPVSAPERARRAAAVGRPLAVIAGRPNTGKSSLFNALTGRRQRVANFAGTTVQAAAGWLAAGDVEIEIVDLPGLGALVALSPDEEEALRYLGSAASSGRPLQVLCLAEASRLETDLAVPIALKSLGHPVRVVVNMMDEARRNGLAIDGGRLSRELGCPVVLASVRAGEGVGEVRGLCARSAAWDPSPALEADEKALLRVFGESLAESRRVAAACVRREGRGLLPILARSARIDGWAFHALAGPLALAGVLVVLFQALFTWSAPLSDCLESGLSALALALRPSLAAAPFLQSLACDGVLPGIAAVVVFVPQIALLFLMLGILEQSGYLPRAAATFDRALRPFGLGGPVVIPWLSSFACAIPGIMAARAIPTSPRRLAATLLAPLMTCSARIPVYALIIAAFVPSGPCALGLGAQGLVMAGLYLFGVLLALSLAWLLKGAFRERFPAPVTILPPYRIPRARDVARQAWTQTAHFLTRAGRTIFLMSLALWVLGRYPGPGLDNSVLGWLGGSVEPLFRPLGFDWRLSVAILASLAAREVFVGTLGTIFALEASDSVGLVEALRRAQGPDGAPAYDLATAVSLLIFFAVSVQCVSTLAVVRRETGGWKWPAVQFASLFALAYALAWTGFRVTKLILY